MFTQLWLEGYKNTSCEPTVEGILQPIQFRLSALDSFLPLHPEIETCGKRKFSSLQPCCWSALSLLKLMCQCGGIGYTGETTYVSGAVCQYSNDWYSQCATGTAATTTTTKTTTTKKSSSTSTTNSPTTSIKTSTTTKTTTTGSSNPTSANGLEGYASLNGGTTGGAGGATT
ncbi:hypothetical protein M407DRAFT_31149 [Tulasnella calospora MUT 4182]|uniref:CBM1 domain-containing protein n=1 Tax=Tulasnella calospora MUT 4182 TaxID=1051891 RepID=A0A0C3LCL3_9AGAM|nr:hypothetical protein M407DRAFT_31149 [Tulasnella calospora MUT 4182]